MHGSLTRPASGAIALALGVLLGAADLAAAKGLYVGHGRRSAPAADWSVRLNLGGGLQGGTDPWNDVPGADSDWGTLGGYLQAGVEFQLGYQNTLEIAGAWRDIDDEEDFLQLDVDDFGRYLYSLEGSSLGITLRHYHPSRSGSAHWGVGLGVVQAEAFYQEVLGGSVGSVSREEDAGAEAHAVVGFDGRLSPNLALGVEIGYRHTWLAYEDPVLADTGDFSGVFAGLRLGVLFD